MTVSDNGCRGGWSPFHSKGSLTNTHFGIDLELSSFEITKSFPGADESYPRAAELRGFARRMRALARRPELPPLPDAVDIVGTGGDRSGSLNLSTGAALLAAACGLPVFKHGNRSISSRAGSADGLHALGLPLPLDEAAAGRCFAALGFTFLFAPYYHAATKSIAQVRAALGVRTVFNILGPLSNPAAPPFLVV